MRDLLILWLVLAAGGVFCTLRLFAMFSEPDEADERERWEDEWREIEKENGE